MYIYQVEGGEWAAVREWGNATRSAEYEEARKGEPLHF